jgi:hypothetical protein
VTVLVECGGKWRPDGTRANDDHTPSWEVMCHDTRVSSTGRNSNFDAVATDGPKV